MMTPTCLSRMDNLLENLNAALKDEIEESFKLRDELDRAKRHIQILEYAIEHLERKLDGYDSV